MLRKLFNSTDLCVSEKEGVSPGPGLTKKAVAGNKHFKSIRSQQQSRLFQMRRSAKATNATEKKTPTRCLLTWLV